MATYSSANHFSFGGIEISGVLDTKGAGSVAEITVSGTTVESTEVTQTELGIEIRAIIQLVSDGNSNHVLVVLPVVHIEDGPVDFAGFAVAYTKRETPAGDRGIHGSLQYYDLRPINGTASLLD